MLSDSSTCRTLPDEPVVPADLVLAATPIKACIDQGPVGVCSGTEALFEGWCFDPQTFKPVRIYADFQVADLGALTLPEHSDLPLFRRTAKIYERPDVAEYFKDQRIPSAAGFFVTIPIAKSSRYKVSLYAVTSSQETWLLDQREFQVGISGSSLPALSPSNHSQFQFRLDMLKSQGAGTRLIYFWGWCRRRDGQSIDGMRVRMGASTEKLIWGRGRSDIARHFHHRPGTLNSGFEGTVRVEKGVTEIVFEALFRNEWIAVHSIPHGRFRMLKQVLRFPEKVAREGSSAFSRLSFGSAPFVYGNFFEHDPRPIRREKFPRPSADSPTELPKFSIVTPSFNQGNFLDATIRSVIEQQGVRLEYAVMDGASADGSIEVIRRHASALATWASERDNGQSDAIRRGFAQLSGSSTDIMAYLNSDDLLMPGALRFVAEFFHRNPKVDVVYGNRVVIDSSGGETGRWITPFHSLKLLQFVDLIPQETLFWRRRIYDKAGGIDDSFRFAMDWDLLLRFAEAGARMVRLPYFLGCFRVHEHSKTTQQSGTVGAHECDQLRRRTHGRELEGRIIQVEFDKAQWQGLILKTLYRGGIRI